MFWIENILIVFLFVIYELLIIPFVYLKTLMTIFLSSEIGIIRKIGMQLGWIIFGLFIDFFLLLLDCKNLLKILSYSNGFQENVLR